jgi:hypothetical protein
MLSLETAQALKKAGLPWLPQEGDAFYIPLPDLDERVFILSRTGITIQRLQGHPAITFQGAYEWALDYIWVRDVVWLPREAQLRAALEARLDRQPGQPSLRLTVAGERYICEIFVRGRYRTFEADDASEVYAQALLDVL